MTVMALTIQDYLQAAKYPSTGFSLPHFRRDEIPRLRHGRYPAGTPDQPSPPRKNNYKIDNCIVPFENKASPCSVSSDITQHRT